MRWNRSDEPHSIDGRLHSHRPPGLYDLEARPAWSAQRPFAHDDEDPTIRGRDVATSNLVSRVAWEGVNERVRREQRNREIYVPPISLFRWWARRPHALIGALLDAACEVRASPVISDPFSGGGTVALEAARRGLRLYAQDLHPWAVAGLASALDGVDPDALQVAADSVLEVLAQSCVDLYATTCPEHGAGSQLSHVFWVRAHACPSCDKRTHLFPYSLLTMESRRKTEDHGYFGCPRCGLVSPHNATGRRTRSCPACGARLAAPDTPLLADRRARCAEPRCGATFGVFDGSTPEWVPVLVQRVCPAPGGITSHFEKPTPSERTMSDECAVPSALMEGIPQGIETSLLHRAGFATWADLYPPRQMRMLIECAAAIHSLDTTDAIRARLRLAMCGAAEMAGYLSRWDRYYPKAFEAMANHRFPALGFACETNLLAHRGRGTLRRRFAHSINAARWAQENIALDGAVRVASSGSRRRPVGQGALLVCGSSQRQLVSDQSVDLILTDPPYFDDVQYAELASLFLVWARAVDLAPNSVSVDLASEAVANTSRGTGVAEYRSILEKIFREAGRTLKPHGRLILTYHNTDIRAWWALARALHDAGFAVCGLAVAEAENSADHPKRNSKAFTSDLVIECRRATSRRSRPLAVGTGASPEARELYAAGHAIAIAGAVDLPAFIGRYREERGPLADARIRIPKSESK